MAARKQQRSSGPRSKQPQLRSKLARIRLVSLDVDGVMTDGRITYGPGGRADEHPSFHVQDGIAIEWLRKAGLTIAWITGRGCAATRDRAAELGVNEYHERVKDKRACLKEIQQRLGVAPSETLVMGDDLPDLCQLGAVGVFAAPANAVAQVRQRAQIVTKAAGGQGAVRELAEALLGARGEWDAIVERSLG